MTITDQLATTASQVEGLRDGVGRIRGVLEQTEAVLSAADDMLGVADDVLTTAQDAVETSRRWLPRVMLVVAIVGVIGVGVVIVRKRQQAQRERP